MQELLRPRLCLGGMISSIIQSWIRRATDELYSLPEFIKECGVMVKMCLYDMQFLCKVYVICINNIRLLFDVEN